MSFSMGPSLAGAGSTTAPRGAGGGGAGRAGMTGSAAGTPAPAGRPAADPSGGEATADVGASDRGVQPPAREGHAIKAARTGMTTRARLTDEVCDGHRRRSSEVTRSFW